MNTFVFTMCEEPSVNSLCVVVPSRKGWICRGMVQQGNFRMNIIPARNEKSDNEKAEQVHANEMKFVNNG